MYIFTYITLHACLCAVFDDPEDDYGLQDSGGMPLDASADPQAHLPPDLQDLPPPVAMISRTRPTRLAQGNVHCWSACL